MLRAILFIVYCVTSSIGLYKIKSAETFFNRDYIFGFFLYGCGFLLWLIILKYNSLSVAFPVAAGSLIICTQIVGFILLDEKFSAYNIIGCAMVIIGVVLIYVKG